VAEQGPVTSDKELIIIVSRLSSIYADSVVVLPKKNVHRRHIPGVRAGTAEQQTT